MTQLVPATCVLGPGKTGLTIGVTVLNLDGTTYAAFSATGVAETSVAGTYRKAGGVMCPDAGAYLVWGVSGTAYAEATVGGAGTPPTVEEIRAEMDSNSTQLAAIVADTNELQTNQGDWATATGFATPTNITAASGIALAATQGAVTFGQVKIVANVAGQGALDIRNSNAGGYGQLNTGQTGMYNGGVSVGVSNYGGNYGQLNEGNVLAVAGVDAPGVRTAIGLATANLDTQLAALPTDSDVQTAATAALNAYDPPTNAEMEARTLAAASYATASALDAVDNYVDTEVTAIKTVTDKLDTALELDGAVYRYTVNALEQAPTGGSAPSAADIRAEIDANSTQLAAILEDTGTTLPASLATIAGYIDTEVAAILADTNELQTDLVNGGRLDLLIDAIKAKTDGLPTDPADQSAVEAAITSAASSLATAANLATLAGYVDTEVAAIKAKTDNLPASPAAVGSEMVLTVAYDAAKTAATQTSVNDLPTNAELATALAAADDAVLAAVADVPTVAEFEARTLLAADYTVVSDLPSVPTAAAVADAVWDEAIAGHASAGSAGATLAAASAPSAATVADAVWDEALAGHVTTGSAGAALGAAGTAGDPWSTPLPGAYGTGTAGEIVGGLTASLANTGATVTVVSSVDGGNVTVYANDTWRFTVTDDQFALSSYEALALVVKRTARQDDNEAILYLRSDTGLARIDGAAPISAANGTLTKSSTSFTAVVAIAETVGIANGKYTWWLKGFDTTPDPDEGLTLAVGTFTVADPGLQAIA